MKSKLLLCLALVALCVSVSARFVRPWSNAELMEASDLVVIAQPIFTKVLDETNSLGYPSNKTFRSRFRGVETTFKVLDVMKGMPGGDRIVLHYYREELKWGSPPNGPIFISFKAGMTNRYLLYLVKDGPNRYAPVTGQVDPWLSVSQRADNADLLTNRINQAKALLAEFKKTKSLDELQKAYLAVGNIPEPGADKTVPKAVARREAARMCFSLLAVIHQNIDTNFDVNNPGNWPLLSIVPPVMPKGVPCFSGMDPKDIKNPKDRALYEAAIQANEKKGARLNFQVRLRNMDRLATSVVEIILRHDYTTSKKDQNELEDLMKQAKLSPAQMQKIMARFDKRDNKMP